MPIAIDIVLELPQALAEAAIALNRQLDEQPNAIPLGPDAAIPHVSLAMGVIEDHDLEEVKAMLDEEFGDQETFSCRVGPVVQQNNAVGQWMAGLALDRSDDILFMHEDAIGILSEVGFVIPTLGSLHDYQHADPQTLEVIRMFREKGSFEHYRPHVTLGFGSLPGTVQFEPTLFEFQYIGLYHLGDNATCRKRMHQVRLHQPNEIVRGGF